MNNNQQNMNNNQQNMNNNQQNMNNNQQHTTANNNNKIKIVLHRKCYLHIVQNHKGAIDGFDGSIIYMEQQTNKQHKQQTNKQTTNINITVFLQFQIHSNYRTPQQVQQRGMKTNCTITRTTLSDKRHHHNKNYGSTTTHHR